MVSARCDVKKTLTAGRIMNWADNSNVRQVSAAIIRRVDGDCIARAQIWMGRGG
jgi:hypothetical protein